MSRGPTLLTYAALGLLSAAFACHPANSSAEPTTQADQDQAGSDGDGRGELEAVGELSIVQRADKLAHEVLILDGHVDLPWRLQGQIEEQGSIQEDPSEHTGGNFDYPRAQAGGLDAPFMSIYIPARYENNGAKKVADDLIDMVEGIAKNSGGKFALVKNTADVRANFEKGVISLPMGMENGAPVEGKLENVAYFHGRGIRYITLTHSKDNHISDSSYDTSRTHEGLSAFGKQVVAEMNRVGIMVDVSHISDDAFWQVMELSKVPVIASHSSCRHFTPGFERNMSDEMIRALAKKGGVIQINFGSGFLDGEIRDARDARRKAVREVVERLGLKVGTPEYATQQKEAEAEYDATHPKELATVETVADHIDHVVKLVGIEHVGLGSDFDGVGDSLPIGLEDVSKYPALFAELMGRGYSDEEIKLLAGENVMRVWAAVEAAAE